MITGISLDIFVSSYFSLAGAMSDSQFCPSMTESYRDYLKAGSFKALFFGFNSTEEEKVMKANSECQLVFKKMANSYPSYFVSEWMIWALALHIWVSKAAPDSTQKEGRAAVRLLLMLGMCLYRYWTYWSCSIAFNGFYSLCNTYFPIADPEAQSYNYKCTSLLDMLREGQVDVDSSDPDIVRVFITNAFIRLRFKFTYNLLLSYTVNAFRLQ